jgi:cellulose synthase/poly-beta-1,6-N-acetylglucosamine synthase-like glycosyltransferase
VTTVVSVIFVALLGYFLIVNALYLGITISAIFHLHAQRGRGYVDLDRLLASSATLPVSVIMPAYNESLVLKDAVTAMLASVYGEFEIIVINDGSTDATLQCAIADFSLEPRDVFHPVPLPTATVRGTYRSRRYPNLWLVDKHNGGGADALNAGLNLSHYPVVAHIDADCIVEPDALMHLMRPINFAPEEIVVVGATLRVANGLELTGGKITGVSLPARLVERFQLLEYLSAFVLNRLGWGSLNAMPVISGACGAWPKRLLLDLGGFSTQDTHCDIEATIHAHAALRSTGVPYRILNVPDATVWTQVPMSWHDLKLQRKRWQRVVFEVLWGYRRLIFNPRYGYFGLICMPYLLIFEGLGPFIESLGFAFVLVLAGLGVFSFKALLLFLCFSLGLSAIVRIVSLLADVLYFRVYSRRSLLTLAALAFLEPLVFHLAQLPQRIVAWFEFLRGQHTHETMVRKPIGGQERLALPTDGGSG